MRRSRSDLIEFVGLVFGIPGVSDGTWASTDELAAEAGIPPQLAAVIGASGLYRPEEVSGRLVYGPDDLRMTKIVSGCIALGAGPEDLAGFGAEAQLRCELCALPACPGPCDNLAALRMLLERLRDRPDVSLTSAPARRRLLTDAITSIERLYDLV